MDGWPGEYLKQPIAEPELYDMRRRHRREANVAAEHPTSSSMLELADRCRDDLGDTIVKRSGKNLRPAGLAP